MRLPKYRPPPPLPLASVYPPPLLRGEDTRRGRGGGVNTYFGRRKIQLCTLPISNPLWSTNSIDRDKKMFRSSFGPLSHFSNYYFYHFYSDSHLKLYSNIRVLLSLVTHHYFFFHYYSASHKSKFFNIKASFYGLSSSHLLSFL